MVLQIWDKYQYLMVTKDFLNMEFLPLNMEFLPLNMEFENFLNIIQLLKHNFWLQICMQVT